MIQTATNNQTDALFPLEPGACRFTGSLNDATRFVEREQLLDAQLWEIFVRQFRSNPDDADNGWRSEYWGKLMRGGVFVYQYTHNEALYAQLEAAMRDLLQTQDAHGRITTYSPEKEFHGWDMWGRKYVLLGMQYFLEICRDTDLASQILTAMCRHADAILERVGEGKISILETSDIWGGMNSASVLEPFVRLYNLTQEQRYLDFSAYIVESGGTQGFHIFEAAYEGKLYPYQYPVTKAYEMMSCFEGLIEYYRVTKIEKWRTAAVNFAKLVAESDITVIGCAGCTHELFDHSRIRQFDPGEIGIVQETCVSVTWMKLCFQILSLTGDAAFADLIEQTAYNALLGAVNINKNKCEGEILPFDSYSPLMHSSRGRLIAGNKTIDGSRVYGCCVAIGAAGLGVAMRSAVMRRSDGFALNHYLPGELTLDPNTALKLHIDTAYPTDGRITIRVNTTNPQTFCLALRIPAWSETTALTLNGIPQTVQTGTYTSLSRTWQEGDTITLCMDMRVRVLHAQDLDPKAPQPNANHFALLRGPIVLARDAALEEGTLTPLHLPQEVHILTDVTPIPSTAQQDYDITLPSGEHLRAVDYASAGQHWNPAHPISVWMPKFSD